MAALFISDGSGEARSACYAKPSPKAQSLQYPMDNFIILDQTGGKGRLFFDPALKCKLFGLAPLSQFQKAIPQDAGLMQSFKRSGANNTEYVGANPDAYKDAIAGSSTSLQSLLSGSLNKWPALKAFTASLASMEIGNSLSDDLPKMELCTSEVMPENSEDLDALLSLGDDSDEAGTYNTVAEEDDDVKSTGHSPDELSGKDQEAESRPPAKEAETRPRAEEAESRPPAKRRTLGNMTDDSDAKQLEELKSISPVSPAMRRCKIRKTVKALRNMIPGGACLDAALVIDETIQYVKILREHVSQLGASCFQSNC